MERALTESIKNKGLRAGADLVGVASVENVRRYAPGSDPAKFLRGAKNVVVALVADPPGIAEAPTEREYMSMAYAGYQKADAALINMLEEVKRRGYSAEFIVRSNVVMKTASGRMAKTLPLKQSASAAGLGSIGMHSLLVNEKYGPRVRLSGMVTDAPLEADEPWDVDLCDNCRACERECPSGAIPEDGANSLMLCSMYLFAGVKGREVAGAVKNFNASVIAENVAKLAAAGAGWAESLAMGRSLYYTCGNCVKVCRVHERLEAKKKRMQSKASPARKTGKTRA